MKKILAILLVPFMTSCFKASTSQRDVEGYARARIDNVISSLKQEAEQKSLSVQVIDAIIDMRMVTTFRDYKNELLEAFAAISYQEIEEVLTFDHLINIELQESVGVHLEQSLEYVITSNRPDLSPSYYRYYKIDKIDGEKLKELADKVNDEYKELVDPSSSRGTINDYIELKKPNYKPSYRIYGLNGVNDSELRNDKESLVFNKIKEAEYVSISMPEETDKYALIYDVNKQLNRTGFGWEYYLRKDYQTIELKYLYLVEENDNKAEQSKMFYYQVSLEDGQAIYKAAKDRNFQP